MTYVAGTKTGTRRKVWRSNYRHVEATTDRRYYLSGVAIFQ